MNTRQEQNGSQPAASREGVGPANQLTVAIATYNGRELVQGVLESLTKQTLWEQIHVVVVDDHSSDGVVEWLRGQWPTVEVIAHERNFGVTRSLNDCLAAGTGDFVALLNNDVELEPDCLELLVRELEEHPNAAASSPKLLDYHHREYLDGAGDIYTWSGMAGRRGHGELDRGQYDRGEEVFGACAAVAVYRRSAVDAVGPFDPDFFAYLEDVDWSMRAILAGFVCRYQPLAVAYHMGSATLGEGPSEFNLYHIWRNGLWITAKNMPSGLILRHLPELIAGQVWHLITALRNKRLRTWVRAWADAIRGLPGAMSKRTEVKARTTVPASELARLISRR